MTSSETLTTTKRLNRAPDNKTITTKDRKEEKMKLLENTNFERLSDALTTEDSLDGRIDARIESYR